MRHRLFLTAFRVSIGSMAGAFLCVGAPASADTIASLLTAHNQERATLGVPPLRWNPQLAAQAAKWATVLTTMDHLEHAEADKGDPIRADEGENLWRGSTAEYSPEQMVALWISEKKDFINATFPNISKTGVWEDVGHYTQVVWKSTTEVGCAISKTGEDEILVCRYLEGGNINDERVY